MPLFERIDPRSLARTICGDQNSGQELSFKDIARLLDGTSTEQLAQLSDPILSLDAAAALILAIRLGEANQEPDVLFDMSRALLLTLLAVSLEGGMKSAAKGLWRLSTQSVCAGMEGRGWRLIPEVRHFDKVHLPLWRRVNWANEIAGRITSTRWTSYLRFRTVLELVAPHLRLLITPGEEARSELDIMLGSLSSQRFGFEAPDLEPMFVRKKPARLAQSVGRCT